MNLPLRFSSSSFEKSEASLETQDNVHLIYSFLIYSPVYHLDLQDTQKRDTHQRVRTTALPLLVYLTPKHTLQHHAPLGIKAKASRRKGGQKVSQWKDDTKRFYHWRWKYTDDQLERQWKYRGLGRCGRADEEAQLGH